MFLRRILHQRFLETKQSNEEPLVPPFHDLNVMPGGPRAENIWQLDFAYRNKVDQHVPILLITVYNVKVKYVQ